MGLWTAPALASKISATIYKAAGLRMHTHLFRHLAGYLILKKRPHELKTVSDLLGHRSLETTRAFYSGMDQVAASERFHKILSEYLEEDGRDPVD